jgi:hypothetical protein
MFPSFQPPTPESTEPGQTPPTTTASPDITPPTPPPTSTFEPVITPPTPEPTKPGEATEQKLFVLYPTIRLLR